MVRKYFLVILLALGCANCSVAQAQLPFERLLNQQFNTWVLNNVQEKIFVQTNSNAYLPGDTIWFKSTLVNAITHAPNPVEKLLYVDLVSSRNEVVFHQVFRVFHGFSAGCIPVGGNAVPGVYKLVAYTNYMRNFPADFIFQRPVRIAGISPDGGNEQIPGLDPSARQQVPADGHLQLLPEGEDRAEVRKDGYGLQLAGQDADSLRFLLLRPEQSTDSFILVGHTRGMVELLHSGQFRRNKTELSFPKSLFSGGIAAFTLFADQQPVAERLVLIDRESSLHIDIQPNKQTYGKREKVNLSIRITDKEGRPVQGSFSLNAFDTGLEQSVDLSDNIRNYLLFSSDLRGEVFPDPGIFSQEHPDNEGNIDLLVQTGGWRRYSWEDILSGEEKKPYAIEKGLNLSGVVRRKINHKPVENAEIILLMKSRTRGLIVDSVKTNSEGEFSCPLPDISDSVRITLQTRSKLGMRADYQIELTTNLHRKKISALLFDRVSRESVVPISRYDPEPEEQVKGAPENRNKPPRKDNYYYPGKDTFLIEEVEVTASFPTLRDSLLEQYGNPTAVLERQQLKTIVEESKYYATIWDLIKDKVPGLTIFYESLGAGHNLFLAGEENHVYFYVRENPTGFLYIIVDRRVINLGDSTPGGQVQLLNYLDVKNIQSIDFIPIVKNSETFNLNSLVSRWDLTGDLDLNKPVSLLLITTPLGDGLYYRPAKGITTLSVNGFTEYREFYAPRYESGASRNRHVMDFRKTIYWEPNVVTDSLGYASVSFYTSDSDHPVGILFQGISNAGEPGSVSFFLDKPVVTPQVPRIQTTPVEPENADTPDMHHLVRVAVTDESGIPLSSAQITRPDPYFHLCANREGECLLPESLYHPGDSLVVTCPGYQEKAISIPDLEKNNRVELAKATVSLSKASETALQIVQKAIRQSAEHYRLDKAYQGYFRETVFIDHDTYGILECGFSYTNNQKPWDKDWLRFHTGQFKWMEDRTGHRLYILKPNHRDGYYPLRSDVVSMKPPFWDLNRINTMKEFRFQLLGEVKYQNKSCYKIAFDQQENLMLPLQQGILYIEKDGYMLLHAQWTNAPKSRKYLNYITYLRSKPLNFDLSVSQTWQEVTYAFDGQQLMLQSAKDQVEILVNGTNTYTIDSQLSVSGESPMPAKKLKDSTPDRLLKEDQAKRMSVKDPKYLYTPWMNLGLIKPESRILKDVRFLHDITVYN